MLDTRTNYRNLCDYLLIQINKYLNIFSRSREFWHGEKASTQSDLAKKRPSLLALMDIAMCHAQNRHRDCAWKQRDCSARFPLRESLRLKKKLDFSQSAK